ncbi:MAG TPA: ACT domain-containing protein [Thermoanaerobaculia bacterium]|nr:ACT domain-containing protein [Thermoanaerobaculia bacterium]
MTQPLEQVIAGSTFHLAGTYLWVSARAVRNYEKHLMVSRDATETTVVTLPEHLADVDIIEVNRDRWTLLDVAVANPFYCAGFLATIANVLGGAGIDILVISTYSRDWTFVKEEEAQRAAELLRAAGFVQR